jgi:hypothetical protein
MESKDLHLFIKELIFMKESTKSLTILMSELIRCQKDVDERYEELEDRLEKATGEYSKRCITSDMLNLQRISEKIDEEMDSLSEFMDKIK